MARKIATVLPRCYPSREPYHSTQIVAAKSLIFSGKLAHPTEFESVTSAFGEWIVAFAEPIRFYPIARYATEIAKQI